MHLRCHPNLFRHWCRAIPSGHLRFSTTSPNPKKKDGSVKASVKMNMPPSESVGGETNFEALFTKLDVDIANLTERLRDELSKLRAGRADPSIFEILKIKNFDGTVLLRDIAHVVPKGRALAVTVYETTVRLWY